MSAKRYYPSQQLDLAIYHLQNNPHLRGADPKNLQHVTVLGGRVLGRNAWERAKKFLSTTSEPRKTITVDMETLFITYVGDTTRLVCLSKSRKFLKRKLEILQADAGYTHVHTSKDKKFHVYEYRANESEKAA